MSPRKSVKRSVRVQLAPEPLESGPLAPMPRKTSVSGLAARELARSRKPSDLAPHLSAILQVQRHIVAALPDADGVTNAAVGGARDLTDADAASLQLLDGGALVCRAAAGQDAPAPGGRDPHLDEILADAIRLAEPVMVHDLRKDPRNASNGTYSPFGSLVVVPIRYRTRVIGLLTVLAQKPHGFRQSDLHTLQILAGVAGYALGHALEHETRERMASLGRLVAGMAHEINNPLAYVATNIGYVRETLDETGGDLAAADVAALQDALRDAQEGTDRVATIDLADARIRARGRRRTGRGRAAGGHAGCAPNGAEPDPPPRNARRDLRRRPPRHRQRRATWAGLPEPARECRPSDGHQG